MGRDMVDIYLVGVLSDTLDKIWHGKVHDVVSPRQLQDNIGLQHVVHDKGTRGKALIILIIQEPSHQVLCDLLVSGISSILHGVLEEEVFLTQLNSLLPSDGLGRLENENISRIIHVIGIIGS
eukprot:sb/3475884/